VWDRSWADEIDDAAELQVVANDLGEELRMWLRDLRAGRNRQRQARLFYAEAVPEVNQAVRRRGPGRK